MTDLRWRTNLFRWLQRENNLCGGFWRCSHDDSACVGVSPTGELRWFANLHVRAQMSEVAALWAEKCLYLFFYIPTSFIHSLGHGFSLSAHVCQSCGHPSTSWQPKWKDLWYLALDDPCVSWSSHPQHPAQVEHTHFYCPEFSESQVESRSEMLIFKWSTRVCLD